MHGELFLGLDVGTQGTKALLLDVDHGRVVARASASYGLIAGLAPGCAEQHPDTWIEAVRSVAAQVRASQPGAFARVAGIGVSGQQHGLVALDEHDRPLRAAKLWCDTSTNEEARELSELLGRHVPVGYTASKVRWLARHEPQLWKRARTVLLPHDYVNLRLCGARVTEAGDASGTGYFDVLERRYDLRAATIVDAALPAKLAPLIENDAPAGELDEHGARLLGLPAGIPIAAGSGDNMASAFGSGATREGVAVVSLGTSATIFTRSARAQIDPAGLIAPFCDATGGWLPLLCVLNATGVTEEVRRAFSSDHATLTAAAELVEPGCSGLHWLPYLNGERVPDLPRAHGVLAGIRAGSLEPARLYRAAIEGVALNLAWGVERMRALGLSLESARVVGGASRNPLWCRVLADVLEIPLVRLEEAESAALGAALQAAWMMRRRAGERVSADELAQRCVRTSGAPIEPDARQRELYREAGARLRDSAARLFGAR